MLPTSIDVAPHWPHSGHDGRVRPHLGRSWQKCGRSRTKRVDQACTPSIRNGSNPLHKGPGARSSLSRGEAEPRPSHVAQKPKPSYAHSNPTIATLVLSPPTHSRSPVLGKIPSQRSKFGGMLFPRAWIGLNTSTIPERGLRDAGRTRPKSGHLLSTSPRRGRFRGNFGDVRAGADRFTSNRGKIRCARRRA